MDCNTARVYLQLDGTCAAELQHHLGECSSCNHLAQDLTRLDLCLGRAMRAVEVPKGLKGQILERLNTEPTYARSSLVKYAFVTAALAAVVVFSWVTYLLYGTDKPLVTGDTVVRDYNILRPDQADANSQLRLLGYRGCAPSFVNYAYLCGVPSLAVLPGTQYERTPLKVPQFFFAQGENRAVIYVLRRNQYDLGSFAGSDPAYPWQLQIEEDDDNWGFVYLILYTGKDWRWLRSPDRS